MSLRDQRPPWDTAQLEDAPTHITVRVDADVLPDVEALVNLGLYKTRGELVRDGLRRVLRTPGDPAVFGATLGKTGDRVDVRLTAEMAAGVVALVDDDCFPSKSDVLRDGIQRVLQDNNHILDDVDGDTSEVLD